MSKNIKIVLVHANWCGHCTRYFPKDFSEKLTEERKNKIKESELQSLKWQEVVELLNKEQIMTDDLEQEVMENIYLKEQGTKKFVECENGKYNCIDISKKVTGYPTIIAVVEKEDNGVSYYEQYDTFKGNRFSFKEILAFARGEQTGGAVQRYRNKYKKYKQMYAELAKKYNKLIQE
jgi:hypothetical protein